MCKEKEFCPYCGTELTEKMIESINVGYTNTLDFAHLADEDVPSSDSVYIRMRDAGLFKSEKDLQKIESDDIGRVEDIL